MQMVCGAIHAHPRHRPLRFTNTHTHTQSTTNLFGRPAGHQRHDTMQRADAVLPIRGAIVAQSVGDALNLALELLLGGAAATTKKRGSSGWMVGSEGHVREGCVYER